MDLLEVSHQLSDFREETRFLEKKVEENGSRCVRFQHLCDLCLCFC